MNEIKGIINSVLYGIDMTEIEDSDGWWETSTGAEFGKKKKELLIATLRSHLIRKDENRKERKKLFKEDGSCTNKCRWGYGVVIKTGICIAFEECKKEFCK